MANRKRRRRHATKRFLVFVIIFLAILSGIVLIVYFLTKAPTDKADHSDAIDLPSQTQRIAAEEQTPEPEPTATPAPTYTPAKYTPQAHESALPEVLGVKSELNLNGDDISSYSREESFEFSGLGAYSKLPGIVSFRGDHYRNGGTYGTADVQKKTLTHVWSVSTGSLPKATGTGSWTGNGWTGQPLIVEWPEATRKAMNINDEKKNKDGLVEVIYASMDGTVYFIDLDDGVKTRKNIDIGLPFKGAGALDPRGYPLLYLGAGDSVPAHHGRKAQSQEFFIYSLIDGSQLYSFGKSRDPFAPRGWHAYDSSALVDAGTDTLIEPGENGVLYMMKLNSSFDAESGTMTIDPGDMLKFRYSTTRSRDGLKNNTYWLGMEASAAIWHKWLYICDNCGTLLCIDTDTMKVVWAQDTLDDSNSSPVLEEEDGKPYIYTSTSLHWTKDKNNQGNIPIWKIDGLTGEIIWQRDYLCRTVEGVSGGVEASGLLGQNDISDLIIYPLARTPRTSTGKLVALDKHTGEEVWVYDMQYYAWSSPVAVYDKNGKGYVIICDSHGNMTLLDGKTGALLDQINLGGDSGVTIESTPAVYGDMIVVGTRGQKICGVRIG